MPREHKYIEELEIAWRVKIRFGKKQITKHFNYEKLNGKDLALEAAIKWRNNELKKRNLIERLNYIKSPDFYREIEDVPHPCIGIYMTVSKGNWNWTARYGNEKKKHFSIDKYGMNKAFRMACEIRYKHAGRIVVINKDFIPCKIKVPHIALQSEY